MPELSRALLLCCALYVETALPALSQTPALMAPIGSLGRYTFAPNQLAANMWYRPNGHLVNGHIAESFGEDQYWPELRRFLQMTNGAFGLNAAEIGYLDSEWLLHIRQAGLRVSVEMPAWAQCASGIELAKAEVFGDPVAGRDIFKSVFKIKDIDGRSDPFRHGWLFTRDNKDYEPDEIVLDHRITLLLPNFNNDVLLSSKEDWQVRKRIATQDPCPAADGFHRPHVDRLTGALLDYVDYVRVMTRKFPSMPAFSFHWNVNASWEWGDEQCLDSLHELRPDEASFDKAFRYVEIGCHRDTTILERLVNILCKAGECPATVFMDVDLHYQTAYALDVLRRNKAVLRKYGIAFGIDLADECDERVACVQVISPPNEMRLKTEVARDIKSENLLDRQSLVNKFEFLIANGVIDEDSRVRFESWSVRPYESGKEVAESKEGSFANTVLLLLRQFTTSTQVDKRLK